MALVPSSSHPSSGGGFTPVSCLLARDADFDIKAIGDYDVLWDALYDNYWDLNPLAAIPAGLGLAFAVNGSSSLVAPTEAGVWAFSYFGERAADVGWAGSLRLGFGINLPWIQQLNAVGSANGYPFLNGSITVPLPSGTQITHQVATVTAAATGGPYVCAQMYLSIVRLA